MQEVWSGKGDHKLIYRHGRTNATTTASAAPVRYDLDNVPYTILHRYGRICTEEKFTVLPYDVRLLVANTVDGWVERNPVTRVCVADALAGSLTLMAHGTHQIYCSFDRFLNCNFNDEKLLKILRCYKNCIPEPGTYFGEIVAQFFQHCKQQSNLNVKRTTRGCAVSRHLNNTRPTTGSHVGERPTGGDAESDTRYEQYADTISRLLDATLKNNRTDEDSTSTGDNKTFQSQYKAKRPKADMDRKFEVIMSLKRAAKVVLMFRCVQAGKLPAGGNDVLQIYLKKKIFNTLLAPDGGQLLDQWPYEFSVKQFENEPAGEIYFSLTVYRKNKYDAVLDDLFECVDIHNNSIHDGVKHRLGVCTLVYCSDTLYFMGMSQTLFVDNSVTFLYCFLTEKYRPVIETKEDSFVFGLVKILSSIEYFTECSLKRNHNGKLGHGPLTAVISEGGLNESVKYVNNLFRNSLLSGHENGGGADAVKNGECAITRNVAVGTPSGVEESPDELFSPISPTYAIGSPHSLPNTSDMDVTVNGWESEAVCRDHVDHNGGVVAGTKDNVKRYYVINEPYINTFLNKPVECGSMY